MNNNSNNKYNIQFRYDTEIMSVYSTCIISKDFRRNIEDEKRVNLLRDLAYPSEYFYKLIHVGGTAMINGVPTQMGDLKYFTVEFEIPYSPYSVYLPGYGYT